MSNLAGCRSLGLGMTYGTESSIRKVTLLVSERTYPNSFTAYSSTPDNCRTILNFAQGYLHSAAHMNACRPLGSEVHWMATGIHCWHHRGWRGAGPWGGKIFRIVSGEFSV